MVITLHTVRPEVGNGLRYETLQELLYLTSLYGKYLFGRQFIQAIVASSYILLFLHDTCNITITIAISKELNSSAGRAGDSFVTTV